MFEICDYKKLNRMAYDILKFGLIQKKFLNCNINDTTLKFLTE